MYTGGEGSNIFLDSIANDFKPAGFVKWNTKFNDNLNWSKILDPCNKQQENASLDGFK